MACLQKILKRPENEKSFLLLAVGYLAKGAQVPNPQKKRWKSLPLGNYNPSLSSSPLWAMPFAPSQNRPLQVGHP
jgi:hypothetical protein